MKRAVQLEFEPIVAWQEAIAPRVRKPFVRDHEGKFTRIPAGWPFRLAVWLVPIREAHKHDARRDPFCEGCATFGLCKLHEMEDSARAELVARARRGRHTPSSVAASPKAQPSTWREDQESGRRR